MVMTTMITCFLIATTVGAVHCLAVRPRVDVFSVLHVLFLYLASKFTHSFISADDYELRQQVRGSTVKFQKLYSNGRNLFL